MNEYGTLTVQKNGQVEQSTISSNFQQIAGTITVVQTCDWADRYTYVPTLSSANPDNAAYLLTNYTIEEITGNLAKINLIYTAQAETLPATTAVEQSSQVEVDIREHPSFSDWSAEWDSTNQQFLPTSTKYGITSYIRGTTTVTITEYFWSKPSSNRGNIGKTQSPGGDFGDGTNWLVIGSTRQLQNNLWTRVTTYLYSATAWNADIYPSA